MKTILIDTNAYAAFKKGFKEIVEIMQFAEKLAITPIVLGELLVGFDGGNKSKQNRLELQEFLDSPRVKIYSVSSDTAHFFSQVHSSLKRKGKPIPTHDMWIAAQALEQGFPVCTYDKHFHEIDGLVIGTNLSELVIG